MNEPKVTVVLPGFWALNKEEQAQKARLAVKKQRKPGIVREAEQRISWQ